MKNTFHKYILLFIIVTLGLACSRGQNSNHTTVDPLILSKSTIFKVEDDVFRKGDQLALKATFKNFETTDIDDKNIEVAKVYYYLNQGSYGVQNHNEILTLDTNGLREDEYSISANLFIHGTFISSANLGSFKLIDNPVPQLESFSIQEAIKNSGNVITVPYGELTINVSFFDTDFQEVMFYLKSCSSGRYHLINQTKTPVSNTVLEYKLIEWVHIDHLSLKILARDDFGLAPAHYFKLQLSEIERVKIGLLNQKEDLSLFLSHQQKHMCEGEEHKIEDGKTTN